MKKIILCLVFIAISNITYAYDFESCQIVEIIFGSDYRNCHVRLSCEISNRPSCATSINNFAFDRASTSGQQTLSLLTAAFTNGARVSGNVNHDANSCPSWQINVSELNMLRVSYKSL